MSDATRRVWRAGPFTMAAVVIFALASGVAIPVLGYLAYLNQRSAWIPAILGGLTAVALFYIWRFGLHPRVQVSDRSIEVVNPFRRHAFDWDDITVIAPGENGLIVATDDAEAEAWCIQKSNFAARRGHLTRADRIADQLLDILDEHDPPLEDLEEGLRIRRVRPHEVRLLVRLERAASESALSDIFAAEEHPYPTAAVAARWRRRLRDRRVRAYLLERRGEPIGYVAFDKSTLHHLGVTPDYTRRGYGSALLDFATSEIYALGSVQAQLWVLAEAPARDFYAHNGWQQTDEVKQSEYPPHPDLVKMVRRNPAAARRGHAV